MARSNWKRVQPRSLCNAMELCLQHARDVHNRSVERVAELMGLTSHWVLYKWMESGRIPAIQIQAFEYSCGIDCVTRYLAHSAHKLLIDIPTGRKASHKDIHDLQAAIHEAVGSLIKFYNDKADADETVAAITGVMEDLAWHRGTVKKHHQPEFDLEGNT